MLVFDVVVCSDGREQDAESLEQWNFALESREIKVRNTTQYICELGVGKLVNKSSHSELMW